LLFRPFIVHVCSHQTYLRGCGTVYLAE
jgi:uncharacterized damage-inducible protein DinB